jgi:hypothetical protein
MVVQAEQQRQAKDLLAVLVEQLMAVLEAVEQEQQVQQELQPTAGLAESA